MTNHLQRLENKIYKCNKCPRLRAVSPTPWPHVYYGKSEDLTLMIVMRNPGLENDPNKIGLEEFKAQYKDLWLRCRVGRYLLQTLGKDIVMNKMFFCNICKCSSPNNSSLTPKEIDSCKNYLKIQMAIIQPKVIISFGMEANSVLKSMNIQYPLHTMLHPSFLSRCGDPTISKKQAHEIDIIIKKYNI